MFIPTDHRIDARQDLPNDPPDQTQITITPSRTTVQPTNTGGLLSTAAAGTNLAWWQLLCIGLGGAIALCILVWVYWRHKRKRKIDKKRVSEAEKEEAARVKEELERQKREAKGEEKSKGRKGKRRDSGSSGSRSWSGSSSESYDSISDGGTIRPRRRRRMVDRRGRGRRHGRGRRRWSESETESDSEDTEFDYIPRKRRDRRRGRYGRGESDDEINDIYDRRHGKQGRRYEPEMPPPAPVNTRGAGRSKRETFRDSVFSSYSSMKKAAVRLKYVEQKVKLKKQLEAEEAVEQARREKVIQANRDLKRQQEEEKKLRIIEEIRAEKKLKRVEREMEEANREVEEANRRLERSRGRMSKEQGSGDSGRPLIPPARSYTLSSSGSSGSSKRFPAPPGRHQTRPPPNGNPSQTRAAETLFDAESAAVPRQKSILRPPRKQSTIAPTAVLPYATPRPTRKGSALGSEINHLLGADSQPSKNRPLYPPPQGVVKVPPLPPQMQNDFQASWLSRPGPALSVPQTARTDSVYVSVTRPKDRPIIPPGGLAPAPPGKKRQERKITSTGIDSASGNNKWTNRLRAKR